MHTSLDYDILADAQRKDPETPVYRSRTSITNLQYSGGTSQITRKAMLGVLNIPGFGYMRLGKIMNIKNIVVRSV